MGVLMPDEFLNIFCCCGCHLQEKDTYNVNVSVVSEVSPPSSLSKTSPCLCRPIVADIVLFLFLHEYIYFCQICVHRYCCVAIAEIG